ncbi:PliI family lysozyme inhibitor of I-type lysozyme [Pseudochrobactrum sp. sp1633]|uniref:PliI family lysozyme inhibitor of I-type lysozyme n=1 Tax=Pseudochrobactrum sp. sp1633 TaxID=3036706 RepID=UPI0025A66D80|nr:PliI family lysozyme inhibitor of I-type lysozyme [Pseudochrobactrum sp. sp1633]MDM8346715.1 PliI family lysozyme inhibitor of I-type lysozyme [Pseudochrobactrum sp. sp1633]HWD13373.1 PliI family lysozyme inhibitor of I-type lysozyme [Pseudochrobactrum sp.]
MRYSAQIVTAALASTLLVAPASAKNAVMVPLPDKRIAVISEGDLESASIGSYTVALYKDDGLIDYLGGGIFARDGSVFDDSGKPRVSFADITGDGNAEMIISKLTAGSGNYLDVDVLKLSDATVERVLNFASDTKKDLLIEAKRAYSQQDQSLKKP